MSARDLVMKVVLNGGGNLTKVMGKNAEAIQKNIELQKSYRAQDKKLQKQLSDIQAYRDARKAQGQISDEMQAAQKRAGELARELETTDGPTRRLTQSFNKQIREVRRLEEQLDHNGTQQRELREQIDKTKNAGETFSQYQRRLRREVDKGRDALDEQGEEYRRLRERIERAGEAEKARQKIMGRMKKTGAVGAGAVAGGGGALAGLLSQGATSDEAAARISAALDGSLKQADQYRRTINAIYGQGLGMDQGQVGETVGAVGSTFGNVSQIGQQKLTELAQQAQTIVDAFQQDAQEVVQVGKILVDNQLAPTATAAMDMIATAFQRVPAQMRDEVLENLHEYSTNFRALGFTGDQALATIVNAAGKGKFALDKTGDSLKEFTIRASDMSKASQSAYEALGLNAEEMSNRVASGGSSARQALVEVSKRLLAIQEPAERANTAIALFGTPLEDLSVDQIPKFLESLTHANDGLGDTAGATNGMLAQLQGALPNAFGRLGRLLRTTANNALADYRGQITAVIGSVLAFAEEHEGLMKTLAKVAAVVAGLVAAFGSITLALLSIVGPAALLQKSWEGLGFKGKFLSRTLGWLSTRALPLAAAAFRALGVAMFANPIGLVIAAVATLAGAAYLLYRNWDSVAGWFGARWADIKAAFDGGIAAIARLLLSWNPIGLLYRGITAALEALGVQIPEQFKTLGGAIVDGLIGGIFGKLGDLKNAITNLGGSAVGWFKGKLGINSPSRVFAAFGDHTVEGYRRGLQRSQPQALDQIGTLGQRIKRAGAGLTLAAGLVPAAQALPNAPAPQLRSAQQITLSAPTLPRVGVDMPRMPDLGMAPTAIPRAEPLQLDRRPPMQAPAAGGGLTIQGGINIEIHATPGTDERALADEVSRQVEAALARAERNRGARRRSSLYDTE